MRIGGGIPGTSHSVLVPGATTPIRWMWDAQGTVVVDDATAHYLLEHKGRSPWFVVDDTPGVPSTAESVPAMPGVESDDDLQPLGQYTFDEPSATEAHATEASAQGATAAAPKTAAKPKPKRKR